MATCSTTELLQAGPCFGCLTAHQTRIAQTVLLCQIKGGSCDPNTLLEAGACFGCLTYYQLQKLVAQLMCNWSG